MLSNSCYRMTTVSSNPHTPNTAWTSIDRSRVDVTLQTGTSFAMLCINIKCQCCTSRYRFDIFTTMDHLSLMRASFIQGVLQLTLPNGTVGQFRHVSSSSGFCDAYILHTLSHVLTISNMLESIYAALRCQDAAALATGETASVEKVFDAIASRIRMRTMFKRMYFRCFRRSFHPCKSQGQRLIQTWRRIWKESEIGKRSDHVAPRGACFNTTAFQSSNQ